MKQMLIQTLYYKDMKFTQEFQKNLKMIFIFLITRN